jgi:phenylpropionate dioxygenase-like ring-hydroxylating dioxygenase large terminal subunit
MDGEDPASVPGLPREGFRNYWYPLTASGRVARRPVTVRAFGEDIALSRSGGRLTALADDRRGYPVEERFGIVWVFIGEGEAPPLEEDLPSQALETNMFPNSTFWEWNCDWRNATENYPDMLHAIFVHRASLHMVLAPIPVWGKILMELLPDGKGFGVYHTFGGLQADYPGLGLFPARCWWRTKLPRLSLGRGRGADHRQGGGEVRMPGYVVLRLHEPFLGFIMVAVQWPYPIDEKRTRTLSLVMTYPRNAVERLACRLWFNGYYRHTLRQFVGQDRRLLESETYRDPEHLSASDAALIQWRRFALKAARRPNPVDRVCANVALEA